MKTDLNESKALIGERLRTIRKARGLTKVDIANTYPIDRETIARLEKGEGTLNSFVVYLNALGELERFLDIFFPYYISIEQRQEQINIMKSKFKL